MTLGWCRPRTQIYLPPSPQREKSEIVNLENKPEPQCHYRITLPSDADYTCTMPAAWVHLRHRETDWFHSKNQYAGVLASHNECIRKLLMGNCIPGALFATFRHQRMALWTREMQKQLSLAYWVPWHRLLHCCVAYKTLCVCIKTLGGTEKKNVFVYVLCGAAQQWCLWFLTLPRRIEEQLEERPSQHHCTL